MGRAEAIAGVRAVLRGQADPPAPLPEAPAFVWGPRAKGDACGVPGCRTGRLHAGGHGEPCRPTQTSCAPLRCYCGACPSWVPRGGPPPPPPEHVHAMADAARRALRAAEDADDDPPELPDVDACAASWVRP